MNFSPDSKFFAVMSKIGDFIVLNILFVITCIPIITIGTSFCALYTTCKKRLYDRESYITKNYIAAWKENFRNATIIWLFFLILLPVLYLFSGFFAQNMNNILIVTAYFVVIILYIFSITYAFPLQASFVNGPFHIIRNSIITALAWLPYTLVLAAITVLPPALTWLVPSALYFTLAYWLLFGFSLNAILSVLITERVFARYR
ncbi:MAG: YesL family protein [Lachnospiraceae bacterium]|nr:YesL family protein [Lachnospiraceae bacterium]